ncbi:hypothetical protein DNI29_21265 [Hymenobacter sediminis]|uniref:hypothetical protein n=1 Tax=Hymenobacter sediminis TaxID=2218621 RepID=UPI000F4F5637|nr:hypothetical protein [Hymenobacter sediminis]RPD44661.1 hypothetical protein DNI29_21265 [Hymenobacter sediminis]
MKRVVIPTDFTLYSLHLIRCALNLLQGEICHITLLRLTPVSDSITDLLTMPRVESQPIDPEFLHALERLQKVYALEIEEIAITYLYCDGSQRLNSFLEENKIDLVLNTVPLTQVSEEMRYFNQLVQDAAFPVLYIPEFFEASRFRKVAFVLDAEAKASALPDKALLNLLRRADSRITFLLVFKPGTSADKLKPALDALYSSAALEEVPYSVHLIHQHDITKGVISFIEEFEVDLVVTCKKKSRLSYLRFGQRSHLPNRAITSKVPCLSVV